LNIQTGAGPRVAALQLESIREAAFKEATHMRCIVVIGLALIGLGCSEKPATIGARALLTPPINVEMLTVTFREGGRTWQARSTEFTTDASMAVPHTREWQTGTHGSLDVAFELADSLGTVVASGQIALPLRSDWRWGIDFFNTGADPELLCVGCLGSRAFAILPAYRAYAGDSLWVVWGGNSISRPIVY
jgi:hypothetical protein